MYKITEEQYNRILEWGEVGTSSESKPETVIKTNRANLSNSVSQAQSDNKITGIEITNESSDDDVISKNDLISEARHDWKKGTKVVKLSSLLKK